MKGQSVTGSLAAITIMIQSTNLKDDEEDDEEEDEDDEDAGRHRRRSKVSWRRSAAGTFPRLLVGNTTCTPTRRRAFSGEGDTQDLEDLAVGMRLHVVGTRQPDTSILARKIQIKGDAPGSRVRDRGVDGRCQGHLPVAGVLGQWLQGHVGRHDVVLTRLLHVQVRDESDREGDHAAEWLRQGVIGDEERSADLLPCRERQRQHPVFLSERDDAGEVVRTLDLASSQCIAQTPQLVLVELVHGLARESRRRVAGRGEAERRERRKELGRIRPGIVIGYWLFVIALVTGYWLLTNWLLAPDETRLSSRAINDQSAITNAIANNQ